MLVRVMVEIPYMEGSALLGIVSLPVGGHMFYTLSFRRDSGWFPLRFQFSGESQADYFYWIPAFIFPCFPWPKFCRN